MGEKYIEKLVKLLGLEKKRDKATPETIQQEDDSPELQGEERQRFATAVGILLHMAADRPDAQHCIRELASALTKPTRSKYKQLEQLVCYLKGTSGYSLHLKWTRVGRSPDDSDWAGNGRTRKSAEYVAMTIGASEAVFLKNCLEFATGRKCLAERSVLVMALFHEVPRRLENLISMLFLRQKLANANVLFLVELQTARQ
eukprot:s1247_g22.t1